MITFGVEKKSLPTFDQEIFDSSWLLLVQRKFLSKDNLLNFFGNWVKYLWTLGNKISAGLSELHSTFPSDWLETSNCFKSFRFFFTFGVRKKILRSFRKKCFGKDLKTATYMSRVNVFERKHHFKFFFEFFWTLNGKFSDFRQEVSGRVMTTTEENKYIEKPF